MSLPSPPAETLQRFRNRNLDFDPGTKYSYSNSGYVLLGLIVEKSSGMKYEDYLRAKIFDPLGMKDSGYDHNETVMPHRAAGYEGGAGALRNASYIDMTIPHAAGSLYSTVEDLYRWDQALYTDKLLPPAARERLFTPFKGEYAYGWMIRTADGLQYVEHGGGINGFATYISRVPEKKLVAIALCNVLPGQPAKVVNDLLALALGKTPAGPALHKEVALEPRILQQYVGEYALGAMTLTMTLEGGQLYTQLTGQPKLPVFAESETRFFLKVVEATLEFKKDASGQVTGAVLDQGGRQLPATRKK
jgi:CubicO group peptidase (beta-lactamase class C family)